MKPKILVIEDDDLQYEIYEESLSAYELLRVCTGREALEVIPKFLPNLILLDHILSDGDFGLDYLPEFQELIPHVPIIVVSGALEVHQQMNCLQGPRRAHYCLTKPIDLDELSKAIEVALNECGETELVKQFEALERSKRIDALELFTRSTDRLVRQNRIRDLVRNEKERPNVSALARQFKVARRTIIRDLQELVRRGQISPEIYPSGEEPDLG